MCIYMYMCIHTCTQYLKSLFSPWEGREQCGVLSVKERNPPQYPGLPFRDAEIAVEEHPSGPVLAGKDSVVNCTPPPSGL